MIDPVSVVTATPDRSCGKYLRLCAEFHLTAQPLSQNIYNLLFLLILTSCPAQPQTGQDVRPIISLSAIVKPLLC